jgi:ATP-dependent RNA helicase RhlB
MQPVDNVEKSQAVESAPVKAESTAWELDNFKVEKAEGKTRFHDVDLPLDIMHAIYDLGFTYCTPIQAEVLKHAAAGRNIAGKAQTGTGKTAAFLLLTFKQFWNNPLQGKRVCGRPRALVLAPTRELVIQIVKDAEAIGKYTPIRSLAIYGGTGYEQQERQLQAGPVDLIAATPGRLIDFYNKRKIDLRGVEVLVIDEADRMLDMGFIPDVRRIVRSTPPKDQRKTLLFSATLSDDVMRLASQWMPEPHMVEIEPEHVAVDTVKQLVYMVKSNEKFTILYNLLQRPNIGRVLIFANRRDQTERVADELQRHGVPCEVLSGAVNQNKRMRVLEDFRSGKITTVVATDVAGRGLHVDGINHVVNFDLPYEAEDYVHRIGRTGRAGSSGTAVSFACEDESFTIPEIEKYIGEELACKYPEDVLLKPLPKPSRPRQRRSPAGRGGGNRGGNRRQSGGRSSRPQSGRRR